VTSAESSRLEDPEWKRWGPYLAERAWGTVREDYSADGDAWGYFPFDHAVSRAYRWNEDGLAGISDDQQRLCLAMAFWNGADPILKERIFGLTGPEGNHGEDAKEHWWFVDSTPTHSWMRWRYAYPVSEFPFDDLRRVNAERSRDEAEFELADTGIFEAGYWDIGVTYAKAGPDDVCVEVSVRNASADTRTLHVLPHLWLRNTWSWGRRDDRGTIELDDESLVAAWDRGSMQLVSDGTAMPLFCDNETNTEMLFVTPGPVSPKDAINRHVVNGEDAVAAERGTKAAWWYRLDVPAGRETSIRLRLAPEGGTLDFDDVMDARRAEADEFYEELLGHVDDPGRRRVARQAFAGLLWSKQYYHYDVEHWLEGDPAMPPPPPQRIEGRNAHWHHLNNADIISMPDTWEYPWYAVWDSAFHCIALAHVDPDFAKDQLLMFCREWFMHPDGQLPAYEWNFGDTNPPVHARAAIEVFRIDGSQDYDFLERICHKLMLNFTWWVNRKDSLGNNLFEGGFLGLDNIGAFDRSADLVDGTVLEQADATAWMAMFCLDMLRMTLILARHDHTYEDLATKFLEHFAYIATALDDQGMWSDDDGFFYDVIRTDSGSQQIAIRSMVGLIPLFAVEHLSESVFDRLPDFANRYEWFVEHRDQYCHSITRGTDTGVLLSAIGAGRFRRILQRVLDPDEFLSDHGIRSMSRWHQSHPYVFEASGSTVGYEPAESRSALFGGNSNWRGPVWFPVNWLLLSSLREHALGLPEDFAVEYPTGSGVERPILEIVSDLSDRLCALFEGTHPPAMAGDPFLSDPGFEDLLIFAEYFDGDTGRGLGAMHQGWTGLVADLIIRAG
jgi:hypothetical protein